MRHLKFLILANLVWFFGFYNLERLVAPINLASFVYLLAFVYAVLLILLSPLHRFSALWIFLAGLVPYFGLKLAFQSPIAGMNLPLTITEIVALAISMVLAHRIGQEVAGLRSEILRLTLGPASVTARPFQTAQSECFREIRRARHYNRPAALLSIAPSKETVDLSISRFLQEAQNSIIRQYIVARTADLLRNVLKETDIITMHNNHFLVLMPETEQKHVDNIINRLQSSAHQKLGLNLSVGSATFPDEAITFESLVENAEMRMKEIDLNYQVSSSQPAASLDGGEELMVELQANKELNQV